MSDHAVRRLGDSGPVVSAIGLGFDNLGRARTATFTPQGAQALVHAALDTGITLFDTADVYGRDAGRNRNSWVAPWVPGVPRWWWRPRSAWTPGGPTDRTTGPGDPAGTSGPPCPPRSAGWAPTGSTCTSCTSRIRSPRWTRPSAPWTISSATASCGTSATPLRRLAAGRRRSPGPPRPPHPLRLRPERVLAAGPGDRTGADPGGPAFGVGVLPYFPLANGLLTGKYGPDAAPAGRLREVEPHLLESAPWDVLQALRAFADARGLTMLEVAFDWLLGRPQVSGVIAGATSPEQVRRNAAATRYVPTPADLVEIDAIFPPPGV